MTPRNVVILGAGGAGMMCAIESGKRGRKTLLIDHASKLGGKILISGGGRCNFTNLGAGPANYVSKNEHFCKSALSRYTPAKFIEMVERHGIAYHEKKLGQQFCDHSAQDIVDLLRTECEWADAEFSMNTRIERIEQLPPESAPLRFRVHVSRAGVPDSVDCESLVVATGGLSIPKIGATGIGYEIAKQFGLKLIERAPALDGFTFQDSDTASLRELAGLSIDVIIRCNGKSFRENILFTHAGLSGPAALQASLHWYPGDEVQVDLLPGKDPFEWFMEKKRSGNRGQVKNLLCELLPSRFAEKFCAMHFPSELPLPQVSEKALQQFCSLLKEWTFVPAGTVGYSKAEVTRGGVDTDELSSKTLEARQVAGLFFIGEVVDVTGWLGGYNFQWAWASAWAAGQVV
jgi:predicted Rossmann fold flavoprotein